MNEFSIEEILSKITEEEALHLENTLVANLYDREWCTKHEIDYCNPNVDRAREITYLKYYKKKKYGR